MTIHRHGSGSDVYFTYESAKNIVSNILPTDTIVNIKDFRFEIIPKLPDTVKGLYIEYTKDKKLILPLVTVCGFPSNLRVLSIRNAKKNPTPLQLPAFPDTLELLVLDQTNISQNELPPLPNSLKRLFIRDCPFTNLPLLPKSLNSIFLSNLQIERLDQEFPENLSDLVLHNTPIQELTFPPNIESIELEGVPIRKIPPLRSKKLEYITIDPYLLEEPFKSIYEKFNEYTVENIEQLNDPRPAAKFLKNAVNRVYNIPEAFRERQENQKRKLRNLTALRLTAKPNSYLPPGLASEVGSFLSGQPATMSMNQQLQNIKRKIPEFQPGGITQQPVIPPHQQIKNNIKTRYRLQKAIEEEKKNKKGGKQRKTRRNKKN